MDANQSKTLKVADRQERDAVHAKVAEVLDVLFQTSAPAFKGGPANPSSRHEPFNVPPVSLHIAKGSPVPGYPHRSVVYRRYVGLGL
jgi:hypothetical protein